MTLENQQCLPQDTVSLLRGAQSPPLGEAGLRASVLRSRCGWGAVRGQVINGLEASPGLSGHWLWASQGPVGTPRWTDPEPPAGALGVGPLGSASCSPAQPSPRLASLPGQRGREWLQVRQLSRFQILPLPTMGLTRGAVVLRQCVWGNLLHSDQWLVY